jgi:cysteinyl-tRNA synthetase
MADIIGILEDDDKSADDGLVDNLMNLIIDIRQNARKNKDWATADKIRDELKNIGITLEDSPTGVRWKK